MRYSHRNAPGATVHDIEGRQRIEHVMEVDTSKGEILVVLWPYRLNADGDAVEMETLRFRAIYPIYGGAIMPCAFHCYGPGHAPSTDRVRTV